MPGLIRQTRWIVSAASMLLVATGCNRGGGEASAGGDVVGSTPAATTGVQRDTLDLNEADDRVEDALRADSTLAPFQLDADDERGRIVLEGVVATQAQKDRAADIAASAAPDISVDNQLRVDAAAARTHAAADAADEAEGRVEDALDADTALRAFNLDADDENGRLVLKGTVRTAAQRDRAEDVAKQTAPDIRIENRIRVE